MINNDIQNKRNIKISLFNINDASPAGERFREPALGLGYIKAYFDKYSYFKGRVSVNILKDDIWNTLIMDNPDIIGISSVTQDYTNAIRYARRIRVNGSRALMIIGGIHISNLPESFDDAFDIGIIGEGEVIFKDTIEAICEFGFHREKLSFIKGLLYKEGEKIINTGKMALVEDLDSIPLPYRKYLVLDSFPHLITARGCPYKCAYCSSTAFWGNNVRFHSPQRVVDEIKSLINEYQQKHISIWDDLFSINKKRLAEIVNLIGKDKRIFKGVTFGINARPNVIDQELCKLLKEMNVVRVSMGIESGSERILKLLNRCLTVEQNYKAINMLKEYGFTVNGGFIIGSPGETVVDLRKTLDFVLNSKLDGGGIGFAQPYPNTDFWNYAKGKGIVSNQMDFSRFVFISDPIEFRSKHEYITLCENTKNEESLSLIVKIYSIFAKKNINSFFNLSNLSLRNILMVFKRPNIFLPFMLSNLKKAIKVIFQDV